MCSSYTLPRRHPERNLLILGNGLRYETETGTPDVTFIFNGLGAVDARSQEVNVQMTRDAHGRHQLVLRSSGNPDGLADLEHRLNQMLDEHAQTLGCLPSSGYALVHGLWSSHEDVMVDGIWFNPSLTRPADLGQRKPLPQAFHNWLGERRTTFQRWLTKPPIDWSWPLINGHTPQDAQAGTAAPQGRIHHTQLLDAMLRSTRTGEMHELEEITQASIEPSPELLQASDKTIQLEQMFHLHRSQSNTKNWWLYDTHASTVIEQIAERLRHAQYLAFSQAALKPKAAD
ncbi:hypothetical protein WNB94_13775 [Aquabacterium sp. A3]|uniref:hypothetical protein n=1 Tax=Aquabacterium sp. A3 TaxID=3132829 RepID=UPI00311A80D2